MNSIDPSSLSPAPESEIGSPAPSFTSGSTSRKRSRTETSSEERKEARAHRNRIAAQNSRDRRKAQFQYLERRVAELEEENRALRAGRGISLLPIPSTSLNIEDEHKRLEVRERDRENEELKERIKTLERGWDAVIKALAAQGVPLATSASQPTSLVQARAHSPPSTGGDHPGGPQASSDVPAAGGLNLGFDLGGLFSSTSTSSSALETTSVTNLNNTTIITSPTTDSDPDDATMETLLMEILASPLPVSAKSHSMPAAAATACRSAAQTAGGQITAPAAGTSAKVTSVEREGVVEGSASGGIRSGREGVDLEGQANLDLGLNEWDHGVEMQRILASLGVSDEYEPQQENGLSELDLGLDMGWGYTGTAEGMDVSVF